MNSFLLPMLAQATEAATQAAAAVTNAAASATQSAEGGMAALAGTAAPAANKVREAIVHLGYVDILIIIIYFAFVLGIGFYLKRFTKTGEDFFMAGREMTAWIAGLAFVSANLGSLELMGWASATYQYGILSTHWYWIGAIPAIIFLAIVMMPFYYICKTHSVPGYLNLRFGPASAGLSAISFAFMTVLMSGVNMYSMALVMKAILGWDIHFSIWVSSLTVAAYVVLGGLLSAIFNEVLQFMLIWFGALLVPILGLWEAGGWNGMIARINENITAGIVLPPKDVTKFTADSLTHVWANLGDYGNNPMGINWVGIVFGLGAVISMGYWTTDFLVVQRVMTAKDLRAAKVAPLIGGAFKMLVPFIVILPGLLALANLKQTLYPGDIVNGNDAERLQYVQKLVDDGRVHLDAGTTVAQYAQGIKLSYDEVLPIMLSRYCGPGLLGLGITALIAGFMSGMAGNISAFATVWTYDIYRPMIKANASDSHYVTMGRWSTLIGIFVSIGTAYLCLKSKGIMDYVQALFSFFIAPLFGTVLLGMLWKRATRAGGFWGLLAGTLSSIGMWAWVKIDPKAVQYIALSPKAKDMAENMYRALWCFLVCVVVTWVVSMITAPKPESELVGLVRGATKIPGESNYPWYQRSYFWAVVLGLAFIIVNLLFW